MDAVAPVKSKMKLTNQKPPWRHTRAVKALKRECRKAERTWRKTKLRVHYDLYRNMLREYNSVLPQSQTAALI